MALCSGSDAERAGKGDAELWVLATPVWRGPLGDRAKSAGRFAAAGNYWRDAAGGSFCRFGLRFNQAVPIRSREIDFGRIRVSRHCAFEAGSNDCSSERRLGAGAADLDGFVFERSGIESAYLRDLENHADDSAVEAGSRRKCERRAVGSDGNDWAGDADRLRQRNESPARKSRVAATGTGGARGAWRQLAAHHQWTISGKRDAGAARRNRWRWTGLRGRAFPCSDRAGELAAVERNCYGCQDAGICILDLGVVGAAVWIGPGAQVRRATSFVGTAERGTDDQCKPRAAPSAEFAGSWTSGRGARFAGKRGADDSYIRGVASG